jgi:hypothetical protein
VWLRRVAASTTGVEVSDEQLAAVNIYSHEFHPEWNYTIKPSTC